MSGHWFYNEWGSFLKVKPKSKKGEPEKFKAPYMAVQGDSRRLFWACDEDNDEGAWETTYHVDAIDRCASQYLSDSDQAQAALHSAYIIVHILYTV